MKTKANLRFADMPRDYEALCRLHLPRPIHDKTDYENTVEVADNFTVTCTESALKLVGLRSGVPLFNANLVFSRRHLDNLVAQPRVGQHKGHSPAGGPGAFARFPEDCGQDSQVLQRLGALPRGGDGALAHRGRFELAVEQAEAEGVFVHLVELSVGSRAFDSRIQDDLGECRRTLASVTNDLGAY